jgi:hypothetical protein
MTYPRSCFRHCLWSLLRNLTAFVLGQKKIQAADSSVMLVFNKLHAITCQKTVVLTIKWISNRIIWYKLGPKLYRVSRAAVVNKKLCFCYSFFTNYNFALIIQNYIHENSWKDHFKSIFNKGFTYIKYKSAYRGKLSASLKYIIFVSSILYRSSFKNTKLSLCKWWVGPGAACHTTPALCF